MTQQTYGRRHHATRLAWLPYVDTGTITCPKCNLPIQPGQTWDLGHQDNGTTQPEHAACNRSAGARAGNQARNKPSQRWH